MIPVPFESFQLPFDFFKTLSCGLKLRSNASNPFLMLRICILMLRIPLEWFEFGFECLESLWNGSNLDSNV